jgi:hypothetical protein
MARAYPRANLRPGVSLCADSIPTIKPRSPGGPVLVEQRSRGTPRHGQAFMAQRVNPITGGTPEQPRLCSPGFQETWPSHSCPR